MNPLTLLAILFGLKEATSLGIENLPLFGIDNPEMALLRKQSDFERGESDKQLKAAKELRESESKQQAATTKLAIDTQEAQIQQAIHDALSQKLSEQGNIASKIKGPAAGMAAGQAAGSLFGLQL